MNLSTQKQLARRESTIKRVKQELAELDKQIARSSTRVPMPDKKKNTTAYIHWMLEYEW